MLARVLPLDGAGEWAARRGADQDAALAAFAEVAPVRRLPELAVAPEDVDTLAGLLDGFEPAPAGLPAGRGPERRGRRLAADPSAALRRARRRHADPVAATTS